jgi:molecular chaperone GrpE
MSKGAKKKSMSEKTNEIGEEAIEESVQNNSEAIDQAGFVGIEEVESMRVKLDEMQSKVDEYLDGWQRSRAEFTNYKKRVEREQAQAYQTAAGNILKRFLDIMDDLDRALKNRPQEKDGAEWAAGIELVYRKFLNVLEAEGVKTIDAEGKAFDPNLHEAISHEECEGVPEGQVIEVVKQGYLHGERVLHPAVVRVAK